MKHSTKVRLLALSLAAFMCVGMFAGCSAKTQTKSQTPLVVGYSPFSEKFSPFFADTGYDQDVVDMTQVTLMTTDRTGAIVYNAIKGETIEYNGTKYTYKGPADLKVEYDEASDTTTYTMKIRNDIKFSDGEPLTADDIIFTYYVLSDKSYDGSSTLYSTPIIGMKNYRYNSTLAETTEVSAEEVAAALADPSGDIKDYIINKIITPILTDEYDWCDANKEKYSFTDTNEFYVAAYDFTGSITWEGKDKDTLIAEMIAAYGTDYKTLGANYAGDENYFAGSIEGYASDKLLSEKLAAAGGEEVPNIEGIKKLGQYEVQVKTKGFDAAAVYQIAGIRIAPLHYYGDKSMYDYDNNKFGFTRGDVSAVKAKTTQPMGAGPYKFIKYENKVVYFEANPYYYKGEPRTTYIQFKETLDADKISGVAQGTIDVTDPSGSIKNFDEIKSYNTDTNELSGNTIVTNLVNNLGYGYLGINATTVNVGGDPDSDASKNLRKGIATIFSVYRELAIDSYYGEVATVINYPISSTSWAAPQKTDDDYRVAFSVDVDGNDIYTADMTSDDKYAAAINAAIGYFKAAGYTFDEAAGKFTAAPDGAKLEYEVIIPGDGEGDHPSYMILVKAKEALASIGITLTINDPSDSNVLWDKLDAGSQEMWAAAWGATIDPDMYQVYYSTNVVGLGGTDSNHYHIQDPTLDELILEARTSDDQSFRKTTYKACLDIILDWAVEIPVYQRQNTVIFSPNRVDMSTVTPDITTYWGWMQDIEQLLTIDTSAAADTAANG